MIKKIQAKLTDERSHFKPFNYPWAYDAWLKHEQSHWLHTEVPMLEDVKDWKKRLTTEEKQFLTHIFRFFTQGDIERKANLPISMLCDRYTTDIPRSQIGFIKYVVKPSFDILKLLSPEVKTYIDYLNKNLKMYEEQVAKE